MKKIIGVYRNQNMHWVGDGFPVKNLFSYDRLGQAISPFLLLDYAAPYHFNPTSEQHGVGSHPHRGFETVTIAYQGEVTHKDSSGGGGTIKAGDVPGSKADKRKKIKFTPASFRARPGRRAGAPRKPQAAVAALAPYPGHRPGA